MKKSTFKARLADMRSRAKSRYSGAKSGLKETGTEAAGGALAYGVAAVGSMTGITGKIPGGAYVVPIATIALGHVAKRKSRSLGAGMVGGAAALLAAGIHAKMVSGTLFSAPAVSAAPQAQGYDAGAATIAGYGDAGALQGGADFDARGYDDAEGYDAEGYDDDAGALVSGDALSL